MSLDEKYIQKAADITMIQDLLARYALALDYPKNGGQDLVDLFTEDGVFTIPELSMVAEGHDEIRIFAEGIHSTVPGLHHVTTNIVVDVDGDLATGRAELNEFMLRKEAIYSNIHGCYEDDYVRDGDRWLIKVRRFHAHDNMVSVVTSGKVGEYFEGFMEMCQQFIRT
jgi:ketosteroid isomerase-like protein